MLSVIQFRLLNKLIEKFIPYELIDFLMNTTGIIRIIYGIFDTQNLF
jgi:hypothetical protein